MQPQLRGDQLYAAEFGPVLRFKTDGSGQHTVLCNGLLVFGPEPGRLWITLAIIIIPFVLLSVFVLPHTPLPLTIVGVVCLGLCLLFLLRAASKDPGVVPVRVDNTPDDNIPSMNRVTLARLVGSERASECCTGGGTVVESIPAPVPGNGPSAGGGLIPLAVDDPPSTPGNGLLQYEAKIKYCVSCRRYRGPRTFHCGVCDRCIDMYDHHCPWLGTCVGAFNYAPFLWFMITLQLTLWCTFAICITTPLTFAADRDISVAESLKELRYMPVVLFACAFVLGLPSSVLTFYHLYLVTTAQLTIEHLRRVYANEPNPYNEGCFVNWGRFFGRFDPVSLADTFRRAFVDALDAVRMKREAREAKHREPVPPVPSGSSSAIATPHQLVDDGDGRNGFDYASPDGLAASAPIELHFSGSKLITPASPTAPTVASTPVLPVVMIGAFETPSTRRAAVSALSPRQTGMEGMETLRSSASFHDPAELMAEATVTTQQEACSSSSDMEHIRVRTRRSIVHVASGTHRHDSSTPDRNPRNHHHHQRMSPAHGDGDSPNPAARNDSAHTNGLPGFVLSQPTSARRMSADRMVLPGSTETLRASLSVEGSSYHHA
jgi:palmitoyltransferase ZDHHC9/14/18